MLAAIYSNGITYRKTSEFGLLRDPKKQKRMAKILTKKRLELKNNDNFNISLRELGGKELKTRKAECYNKLNCGPFSNYLFEKEKRILLRQFIKSCRMGDIQKVQKIIKSQKINVNFNNHKGVNGLMYACRKGHLEVVKAILSTQSEYFNYSHSPMIFKFNPFIEACYSGQLEIIKELIKYPNISLNDTDECDMTAFMLVCENIYSEGLTEREVQKYREIEDFLVEIPEIDVNYKGINGSALEDVCLRGDITLLNKLISHPRISKTNLDVSDILIKILKFKSEDTQAKISLISTYVNHTKE